MEKAPFINFLKLALENQTYPGLHYVSRERGIFDIIWVHHSTCNSTKDREMCLAIFKGWEQFKGRCDFENFSTLKAVFRGALNHHSKIGGSLIYHRGIGENVRRYSFATRNRSNVGKVIPFLMIDYVTYNTRILHL